MTISAGTRLGPYEVIAPLGAGGMGEVWHARDTRLDRSVAIKVLPADFATNAEKVLRISYRLGDVEGTSEGRGQTIVAAHSDLRQHLVLDRVRIGVSALYRWRL